MKIEVHREEAVATCELETTRGRRVFAALLGPIVEDVAGSKDSGRRDDGFDHVGTVEASLKVCGPV